MLKYQGNTGRKHILPFQPQFWCMGCQPTWCHWYLVSAKQVGSSSNSSHSVQHPSPSPSALSERGEWRILPITLSREIQNFFPLRIFHSRLWAAARAWPRQCSPIHTPSTTTSEEFNPSPSLCLGPEATSRGVVFRIRAVANVTINASFAKWDQHNEFATSF